MGKGGLATEGTKGTIPSLPPYEERKRPSRRTFLQSILNLNQSGDEKGRLATKCTYFRYSSWETKKWLSWGDRKPGVEQLLRLKEVNSLPLKRSNETASGRNDARAIGQLVRRSAFSLTR